MSSLAYLPSSPTLFNSGTRHTPDVVLLPGRLAARRARLDLRAVPRRSRSCRSSPAASASRGRGCASRGALIRGTNGQSNGIVPWLKTLDASVAAVNQGGRRKGAACVYLEPWHPDIEEFLELRDNTGEDARRTHNLNLANWIPDEFMRRVEADGDWSLFDPTDVPELPDLWGDGVRRGLPGGRGSRAASHGRSRRATSTARMMRTLAQTGNGWMTFKDAVQPRCATRPATPGTRVHLSNLCTEIIEVVRDGETAVCNLGSINLGAPRHRRRRVDLDEAARHGAHRRAVPRPGDRHQLLPDRGRPRRRTRAGGRSGSGVMGLQDVFFALRLPFDSPAARELSTRIAEEIYLTALEASARAGRAARRRTRRSPRPAPRAASCSPTCGASPGTQTATLGRAARADRERRAAQLAADRDRADGHHRVDRRLLRVHRAAGVEPVQARDPVGRVPAGQRYLVRELKARGLWTEEIRDAIKRADGSVQGIVDAAGRGARAVPHRVGAAAAGADRHGRRPRSPYIDQSQSLNLFMAAPDHRQALVDVHATRGRPG